MAFKKRIRPKRKAVPKKSPWVRKCEKLYNRLQADPDDDTLSHMLEELTGFNDSYLAVEEIMRRCDCTVSTIQINYPDYWNFQVSLAYTDRDKKPKHGYLYPRKAVVKTSPRLVHSVMLAYIELCKQVGFFI